MRTFLPDRQASVRLFIIAILSCTNVLFNSRVVFAAVSVPGKVVMETWQDVSGTSVNNIPLTTMPSRTDSISILEGSSNIAENYGVRIRGYIVAPANGDFVFYIASDDNSQLWLSHDTTLAGKSLSASVSGWTNSREWTKYPSQASTVKNLKADSSYYFEMLMKEGTGGDNWAVGWTGPGIASVTVIGGSNIRSYVDPVLGDEENPGIPTALSVIHFTYSTATLVWEEATDNVGIQGYNIYSNGIKINSQPVDAHRFVATGLIPETDYSFAVEAVDLAGNVSGLSIPQVVSTTAHSLADIPSMPVGMNLPSLNYYSTSIIFTDVMTTAGDMFTFYDGGPWNSEQINSIPRDSMGYPKKVPYLAGGQNQKVRFLINNFYSGRYRILYEGEGNLTIGGVGSETSDGKLYVNLNGAGGHVWVNINQSVEGNHIRNIRIVPEEYEDSETIPTFIPEFIEGLRPFHALRYMDWTHTNNSDQKEWDNRPSKKWYTQGGSKGICMEYGIELANQLDADAWVCVPHQATDNYIRNMAILWRDFLDPDQKVYVEYSNEIWNWQFGQSHYYTENAPGNHQYVIDDLKAIGVEYCGDANSYCHPEKGAYMMARVFRIFSEVFTGEDASRLVRVAPVQHAWYANTGRILNYLFNDDGIGADVISPAGYFSFDEDDHNLWLTRCDVSPEEIIDSVMAEYDATSGAWTQGNANYANDYGVGYTVYEGGQHMQPWMQGNHCYNQSVWDAQINPKMYDLYMKNFEKHAEPSVDCSLFMAFSYMGTRESQYGSWGHLESLDQTGVDDFMGIAPKYQALIDVAAPRTIEPPIIVTVDPTPDYFEEPDTTTEEPVNYLPYHQNLSINISPNPAQDYLRIDGIAENIEFGIFAVDGRMLLMGQTKPRSTEISVKNLHPGLYCLRLLGTPNEGCNVVLRFIKE